MNRAPSPSSSLSAINYSPATADRDRLALDISALKQQYAKLRERQRQAHIILTGKKFLYSMVNSLTVNEISQFLCIIIL